MTPSIFRDRLLPALSLALLAGCAPSQAPSGSAPAPSSTSNVAVTGEQIQQTPGDPIEKLLMNRSPGVWVGRASDGSLAVRIRGGSSQMANNEPLYIVDGSPFMPGSNGALTGLNPYDIESIKVLKDPADLAMYGVRGANGVIIIKTKQGKRT
jgi:TonB-dependent SusC/RagA subfamily outer membrane receptor